MFFLALIMFGFFSFKELGVDLFPDIKYPHLLVVTQYSGVSPEEIEKMVTAPLEATLRQVQGVQRLKSVSKEGVSYLSLEFSWDTDMNFALLHTKEKIDVVRENLPLSVEEPIIIPLDPQSRPILIMTLYSSSSHVDLKGVGHELIKPRLEQIDGVGLVEIIGSPEREIHVELKPELVNLYGLSVNEISEKIESFNKNIQGGIIKKGGLKYSLRMVGELENVTEIGEIGFQIKEGKEQLKLSELAEIKESFRERESLIRLNGIESIGLLVYKEFNRNTVKVSKEIRLVLEEMAKNHPEIGIRVVYEQAEEVEKAISSVYMAIIFGAMLAFLTLIFFLQDYVAPLIIAFSIPVSIIGTFNFLYFQKINLNIISLGGLALGVGMMVDNSIIVLESIFRNIEFGEEAPYRGTKEIGMAVSASTLTTISVFLPIIYLPDIAGKMFKELSLTVTFSLLSSLVVALTLVPLLVAWLLRSRLKELKVEIEDIRSEKKKLGIALEKRNASRITKFSVAGLLGFLNLCFQAIFKEFCSLYLKIETQHHRLLKFSLKNKRKIICYNMFFIVLIGILILMIKKEFLPSLEYSSFEVKFETPPEYGLEETVAHVSLLENWLMSHKEIETIFSQIGIVSILENLNPDVSLNSARIYVGAKKGVNLERQVKELGEWFRSFPSLSYSLTKGHSYLEKLFFSPQQGMRIKIKGKDLELLARISNELSKKISSFGEGYISSSFKEGKPRLWIKLKKEIAEKYDLSPSIIGDFFVQAIKGKKASELREPGGKYDILVRLHKEKRENIETLLEGMIPYKNSFIPLRELVDYQIIRGPVEILRENQQREVLLNLSFPQLKMQRLKLKVKKTIDSLTLPQGYWVDFNGEEEEMRKSSRNLVMAFCVAVVLVYMIMAAQFESLIHPLLIMVTLPMGLAGAIFFLFICGESLNLISGIGLVVLSGIVVNDAIVKIDYINQLRRKGFELRQAILEASRTRLRPVLMTTLTTVFGLLPLSLGIGKGAALQRPLAIAIIGGLIFSTFLTLVFIPLLYETVEKFTASQEE